AAEERGHFGARLRETEDVVDEQENVLVLFIAEVFGDGERGERNTLACAGWLVHLSVDERGLAENGFAGSELGFLELDVEIVSLARALADAGEAAHAAVFFCDVVDELHDEDGLADASAAEEADFSAFSIGC